MRRGPINKPRRRAFPLRILIPLVFLLIGVGVAYSLVAGDGKPDPPRDPIIIRPESYPPIEPDNWGEESAASSLDISLITPIEQIQPQAPPAPEDQFTNARVAAFKTNSAALKKTVDQYAKTRANQCSGEITVRTEDTPLNVRSGPSTGNPIITKVQKDSRQNVLLWAPDSKNPSARWFLLVDDKAKTVKGWVSGEYCDSAGVVFAN